MVRILVVILRALGRWYSCKHICIILKNTGCRTDWTQTEQTHGGTEALEVIQEWGCENLGCSGSCEDEETWTDSEMRIDNPYRSSGCGNKMPRMAAKCLACLSLDGGAIYWKRECWGRKDVEGEGMSSVFGHAEFEVLRDGQVKMLTRQLDLWLGTQRSV